LDELAEISSKEGRSYYDVIADTVLSNAKGYKDVVVVLPEFSLPIPESKDTTIEDNKVEVRHFATDVKSISIYPDKKPEDLVSFLIEKP